MEKGMLRSAVDLRRYTVVAADGPLGRVKDLLFDDRVWIVRYFVADTGTWLPGRWVLMTPSAVQEPDWPRQRLPVRLTREQVRRCPGVDEYRSVSRQYEAELHRHYGWPPYWSGAASGIGPKEIEDPERANLRSLTEIVGYSISAADGDIGHVEDFILEDETWWLRYMVVDTRNWLPGRKVLISLEWIGSIRWSERVVGVEMSQKQIERSPRYDPSAPVNRRYEERLYDYYGRPKYW
jgi:hypothetical protein